MATIYYDAGESIQEAELRWMKMSLAELKMERNCLKDMALRRTDAYLRVYIEALDKILSYYYLDLD